MCDLIEKLSSLRSQFNCFDENKYEAYRTLSEAIKVISERPEPCEDDKGCSNCMYGGRSTYKSPCSECRDKSQWEMKPISRSHENGTECDDAVSRQAVSSWLKQYGQDVLHGKYKFSLMYIWKNLMDLPSVTPKHKTWKWIEYDSNDDKYDVIKCPCCKHIFTVDAYHWTDIGFVKDDFKFCPNCGSKNGDVRNE